MKHLLISLFISSLTTFSLAQNCDCGDELKFVIDYYEANLPGFRDNVTESNQSDYNAFKGKLAEQSQKYCGDKNQCFKILSTYVEFFKDNHSYIYMNSSINVDESKRREVRNFRRSNTFRNREVIKNLNDRFIQPIDSIENVYTTDDGAYEVVIVKSKNEFRDYVGVITASKTKLWRKGQVKFELKRVGENTYDMFMYLRNHSLMHYKNVRLENGMLDNVWFNIHLKERKAHSQSKYNDFEYKFEEIDEATNYMYLPTFDGDRFAEITAFYAKYDSLIRTKPNLIIDVRNNGGGSDGCALPLLKYIYTNPFLDDKVEMYATEENIRKCEEWYEDMAKDTVNYKKEFLTMFRDEIEQMKTVPNKTFIVRGEAETIELEEVLPYPSDVAIISNRGCASSCETLLFWAKESGKTRIVGENSGGFVGYGEISQTETPGFGYVLGCTMTRYSEQRKFEVDGVPPSVYLDRNRDWLEQTIELLKTSN